MSASTKREKEVRQQSGTRFKRRGSPSKTRSTRTRSGRTRQSWNEAMSLYIELYRHRKAGRGQDALASAATLVERFRDASEPPLQKLIAEALAFRSGRLIQLGRDAEAFAAIDELVTLYGNDRDPIELRRMAAWGLMLKGLRLGDSLEYERGVETFAELIRRFRGSSDQVLAEHAFDAFINQSVFLRHLHRTSEELEACRTSIAIFKDSSATSMQVRLATVLLGLAYRLKELERYGESVAAYAEVIERFEGSADGRLREAVSTALTNLTHELRHFRKIWNARIFAARQNVTTVQ